MAEHKLGHARRPGRTARPGTSTILALRPRTSEPGAEQHKAKAAEQHMLSQEMSTKAKRPSNTCLDRRQAPNAEAAEQHMLDQETSTQGQAAEKHMLSQEASVKARQSSNTCSAKR